MGPAASRSSCSIHAPIAAVSDRGQPPEIRLGRCSRAGARGPTPHRLRHNPRVLACRSTDNDGSFMNELAVDRLCAAVNIGSIKPSRMQEGCMRKLLKLLSCGLVASVFAGAAIIALTSQSEARSLAAFLGQPQAPGDYSCFTNNNGSVTNNCGTTKQFCMVLPVDDANHTVSVAVFAPDINHNIACFAQANFQDNSISGFTGFRSPGSFGSSQVLNLGAVVVRGLGNLFACCNLAPIARVESINY
jgi:hypothetical protein